MSQAGGGPLIVCVSGVSTNPNTKPHGSVFLSECTLGPGFRKVRFRAPDPPDPNERSAQTHKTYVVSPKNRLCGQGLRVDVIKKPGLGPSKVVLGGCIRSFKST